MASLIIINDMQKKLKINNKTIKGETNTKNYYQ
jgi:hypothetical protein